MIYRKLLLIVFILSSNLLTGQNNDKYGADDILQSLERVNTLGSILYIAAHPDDENTQLISYLANGKHLRTAYLSVTRGDGGQNLIGPEIRELLGVIRTQELLSARKIDGGEQFFTRANDFGYSKHPDETFNKWDRKEILSDMVWVIRKFRPDVIITRFNTQEGVTHGHHTASAILAKEAFKLSGDSSAYPSQLKYVKPWSPKRLVWNTSSWFFRRSEMEFEEDKYIKLDVGGYNPVLGNSYTEIAAVSRSMHKSQGFGASASRGVDYEYFEHWDGVNGEELFDGLDFTWGRISGSDQVAYHLEQARLNFDPQAPHNILPDLLEARKELLGIPDQYWKEVKLKEIRDLILAVSGTYISATANDYLFTANDSIALELEVINRSPAEINLNALKYSLWDDRILYNIELKNNQRIELESTYKLSDEISNSHPYWLKNKAENGMYDVDNQQLIGKPDNDPVINAEVLLKIDGQFIEYQVPVEFRRTDPVQGESIQPLEFAPEVMVSLDNKALIFGDNTSKKIPVRVTAGKDSVQGNVFLESPEGWTVLPEKASFSLDKKGDEEQIEFELTPPKEPGEALITAVVEHNGKKYDRGIRSIAYDHFPKQTLFPKSETKAVKIDLRKVGDRVGYIMGAGDEVPFSLEQVGYEVTLLEKDQVEFSNLQKFDAVLIGIRAFNTLPWLSFKNETLFDYVKAGGNLIVQYNTSHQLVTEQIAPYPLKLSRNRVTVEEAKVQILRESHPALNYPNVITQNDFNGWVQERGLYFPNEWSEDFVPLFSINDPGEEPKRGSTLIAQYGLGYYCYTGLSFFREMPAGVPGAYRLLVNMISLGKPVPNE